MSWRTVYVDIAVDTRRMILRNRKDYLKFKSTVCQKKVQLSLRRQQFNMRWSQIGISTTNAQRKVNLWLTDDILNLIEQQGHLLHQHTTSWTSSCKWNGIKDCTTTLMTLRHWLGLLQDGVHERSWYEKRNKLMYRQYIMW